MIKPFEKANDPYRAQYPGRGVAKGEGFTIDWAAAPSQFDPPDTTYPGTNPETILAAVKARLDYLRLRNRSYYYTPQDRTGLAEHHIDMALRLLQATDTYYSMKYAKERGIPAPLAPKKSKKPKKLKKK